MNKLEKLYNFKNLARKSSKLINVPALVSSKYFVEKFVEIRISEKDQTKIIPDLS